VLTKSSTG